jgi:hypothetical protein
MRTAQGGTFVPPCAHIFDLHLVIVVFGLSDIIVNTRYLNCLNLKASAEFHGATRA